MTRIIAGMAGGRRLSTPPGRRTRPTSDRVREAVFSSVEHAVGPLAGRRFLDLYAGSGAVGLEAASRGAATVLLVEQDRRVTGVIRDNIAALGLRGATLRAGRVEQVLAAGPPDGRRFDVAFLDPPYTLDDAEVTRVLGLLVEQPWLERGALVVVERSSRGPDPAWPRPYAGTRTRRYGETCVWYGHVSD